MARPLRIEYDGALYHVTARGNGGQRIYLREADGQSFLRLLGDVVKRFGWLCHAYCLMPNHYHLLIETKVANLGRGMRQLNGVYTQRFNHHHHRMGHVFQGRYKAILVAKQSHLLELARYVVLNPVRAGLAEDAERWKWSSYGATAGLGPREAFLTTEWLRSQFGEDEAGAIAAYRQFVHEGGEIRSPWSGLAGGQLLGDEKFVSAVLARLGDGDDIPGPLRKAGRVPLEALRGEDDDGGAWMGRAHDEQGYSLREIAAFAGLHHASVQRRIDAARATPPPPRTSP